MGKGFNNYMTKKFFHPASKENIKRVWMAQQKTDYEKKKQEDLMAQYQKEQEMLSNRALLGDEKAKMGLSFLYDAPPGMKKKEKEDDEPEYKFEWQRKYNAPREAFAKGDDTISDQPFGIEVRNIRCIKCRQWGHVNTDKICPLFGKNLTAEPPQPETSTSSLLAGLKEEGFQLKQSMLGRFMAGEDEEPVLAGEDDDDPEVQFLKSLTPKQKKKLLKKLNKLQKKDTKGKKDKKKKKKSKAKRSSRDSDSDSSDGEKRHPRHQKSARRPEDSDSDADGDVTYTGKGARPKEMKRKASDSQNDVKRQRRYSESNRDYDDSTRRSHATSRRDRSNTPDQSRRHGKITEDRRKQGHKSRPVKRESSSSESEDDRQSPPWNVRDQSGPRNEKMDKRGGPKNHHRRQRPRSSSDSNSDSGSHSRSRSPQDRGKDKGRQAATRGDKDGSPRYRDGRSRSPADRRSGYRSLSREREKKRERSGHKHSRRDRE